LPNPKAHLNLSPRACLWPRSTTTWEWSPLAAGQKKAADYFERAIQNDPSDADYHFNLGVTLAQAGDRAGRHPRTAHCARSHRPNDAEAKMRARFQDDARWQHHAEQRHSKIPAERIKRNYDEDTFRQMTTQMGGWAEQRFARSDPRTHARFHLELGKELMAHGFTTDAEAEFRHAAAVDPVEPRSAHGSGRRLRRARRFCRRPVPKPKPLSGFASRPTAYVVLARLDLRENKTEAASQNINRALQLEPGNAAAQDLKRALAAKLAEKAAAMKPALSSQLSALRNQVSGSQVSGVRALLAGLVRLLFALLATIALAASCSADVLKIVVNDAIQPVTAEYIARARSRSRQPRPSRSDRDEHSRRTGRFDARHHRQNRSFSRARDRLCHAEWQPGRLRRESSSSKPPTLPP
jgi:Flp pilus assembly protein TadD